MTANLTPPSERDFPAARLEQRKGQLVSRIEAELRAPRRPTLARRRWAVAAVAVAAAAGAVALALTVLSPGKEGLSSAGQYIHSLPRVSMRKPGGRQLASLVLLRAARTAANRPTEAAPGPGQFIYTKLEAVWGNYAEGRDGPVAIAFQPHTIENWSRPDGSGHYQDAEGHMIFPTAADAAYFYANDPLSLIDAHTATQGFGPGKPNYDELSQVPTDPAQLKQLLENRTLEGGPPGDWETFNLIGDLLRETGPPPAVRSALYTIASQLPGVLLLGPTQDQLGRTGTGVAYDGHGVRYELIFDPQTSGLLAEQTIVLETSKYEPFPPGSVIDWTAYLASGIVDSDSATTTTAP